MPLQIELGNVPEVKQLRVQHLKSGEIFKRREGDHAILMVAKFEKDPCEFQTHRKMIVIWGTANYPVGEICNFSTGIEVIRLEQLEPTILVPSLNQEP